MIESCMAQFSFPSVFLALGAFMISDFTRDNAYCFKDVKTLVSCIAHGCQRLAP